MVNNADLCDNQVEALFVATYSLIEENGTLRTNN